MASTQPPGPNLVGRFDTEDDAFNTAEGDSIDRLEDDWVLRLSMSSGDSLTTPEEVAPHSRKKMGKDSQGHQPDEMVGSVYEGDLSIHLYDNQERETSTRSPREGSIVGSRPELDHAGALRLPEIGEEIAGFRILSVLGRGAFASVYRAAQIGLSNRQVALKVAAKAIGEESQILAKLQHTHIVPIHSVHEDRRTGLWLLCMPYLGGADLATILEKATESHDQTIERSGVAGGYSLVAALDRACRPSNLTNEEGFDHDESFGSSRGREQIGLRSYRSSPPGSVTQVNSTLGRYFSRLTQFGRPRSEELGEEQEADRGRPSRRFLKNASFIDAAIWITARLAEGLEHAHARGLLHRDLKPSNILITEDGTPMILDFNLSADTELRSSSDEVGKLGGTLPYMSPEHLDAFRPGGTTPSEAVDRRSDIYSLGLILFEMVVGHSPFTEPNPVRPTLRLLQMMIDERIRRVPSAREENPEVSWGLESVIRKSLDPDPDRRYQDAGEFAEDLRRLLESRPLRHAPELSTREIVAKWFRRHPGLTGSTSIALVSIALILGGGVTTAILRENLIVASAQLRFREFQEQFNEIQLKLNTFSRTGNHQDQSIQDGRLLALEALRDLGVESAGADWIKTRALRALPPQEQQLLIEEVAELLQLEARAAVVQAHDLPEGTYAKALVRAIERLNLIEEFDPNPTSALFLERARYYNGLGMADEAEADLEQARSIPMTTARDFYMLGTTALAEGVVDRAEELLDHATGLAPDRYWSWFALGLCHLKQRRYGAAVGDFSVCTVLNDQDPWAFVNRGLALAKDGRQAEASRSYDQAIKLDENLHEARINRALVRLELGDANGAADDLQWVIDHSQSNEPSFLVTWAETLGRLGRESEAEEWFRESLVRRPDDVLIRVARGFFYLDLDSDRARADLDHALSQDPENARAHLGMAHLVRSESTDAALDHLDQAIESDSKLIEAYELRALIRAKLGNRSALNDLETLRNSPTPQRLYNGACVLSTLSESVQDPSLHEDAIHWLRRALESGFPIASIRDDPDLESIRALRAYRRLIKEYQP